jgi:sigma-B regulation protein RsbU (phosphoserine phosphatase)
MITGVVATYDVMALRVKDVYYLVIFAGGMWYQAPGALVTAVLATVAYVIGYSLGADLPLTPASALHTAYDSGAFFMPAVGYAVGVLFKAYSRDLLRLAEMDHEIGLARTLQDQLVPTVVPPLPGWDISYCMGRAREVGGDMYDFVTLPDGSLLVTILDMAGKSVYGLVHLSLLHSQLHDVASRNDNLGDLVTELARRAYPELQPDSYAAGVFLKLTPGSGRVECVNCGHLSPLILTPGAAEPADLSPGQPIIGAYEAYQYRPKDLAIPTGGAIVCYTDGLVEARNGKGSFYGEERLRKTVTENANLPPGTLCSAMLEDVRRFVGRTAADDQTVLVLRRAAEE